jgi:hypothetical protein
MEFYGMRLRVAVWLSLGRCDEKKVEGMDEKRAMVVSCSIQSFSCNHISRHFRNHLLTLDACSTAITPPPQRETATIKVAYRVLHDITQLRGMNGDM